MKCLPRSLGGKTALVLGLVLLPAVGFLLYFNLWLYPGLNLDGYSRQDSEKALNAAALGYALSEDMTMEGFDLVKFREVEGGEAYVFGAALMRPGARLSPTLGDKVLVWVYLTFDGFRRQWVRVDAQVLAAPDAEMFFTDGSPRQPERVRMALTKIVDEEARRFRETWR